MKLGIIVCTYNRPEQTEITLNQLRQSNIPEGTLIVIVDDCSTDPKTRLLIAEYPGAVVLTNPKRSSVSYSLKNGFEYCFKNGCDLVTNIDNDVLLKPDWVLRLVDLKDNFPDHIVSGFNSRTKNADGSDRHPVIREFDTHIFKGSVGGINMMVDRRQYQNYMKPALDKVLAGQGNWDHMTCLNSMKDGQPIVCIKPSVVQHQVTASSMGHNEEPDTAEDFDLLHLPEVTLIIIDCIDLEGALKAVDESTKNIRFGAVHILSSVQHERVTSYIPHISSKESYSQFMIKELHNYIDTPYMLIIQADGYVKNHLAWDNSFLDYDYIGATWWYKDGLNVGNGGFSLRSRNLHRVLAEDPNIKRFHPEDDSICRTYRKYLERTHGMRFAPENVAEKFSIEAYNKKNQDYSGQFGFHGRHVRFNTPQHYDTVCILQPFGLGDVIFCQTLAHSFGVPIVWPVKNHFVEGLRRAYPEIKFISEDRSPISLRCQQDMVENGFRAIPIRFSMTAQRTQYRNVMRAKYDMYKLDWKNWTEKAMWTRDIEQENKLFNSLNITEPYILINKTFGCDFNGHVNIPEEPGRRIVHLQQLEGFSLFDWYKVIQQADEIHTVSTSIIYILELMELKARKIRIYVRRPHERCHENYQYIMKRHHYVFMP